MVHERPVVGPASSPGQRPLGRLPAVLVEGRVEVVAEGAAVLGEQLRRQVVQVGPAQAIRAVRVALWPGQTSSSGRLKPGQQQQQQQAAAGGSLRRSVDCCQLSVTSLIITEVLGYKVVNSMSELSAL